MKSGNYNNLGHESEKFTIIIIMGLVTCNKSTQSTEKCKIIMKKLHWNLLSAFGVHCKKKVIIAKIELEKIEISNNHNSA